MGDFIDKLPLLPVSIDLQNFDYFVDKEEFKKELAQRDDEFCCGLIKQYARRIQLMEKELLAMEEIEDGKIIVTIRKSDLYLCCFAGFASLKWDIFRIAQGVPSMRIRSLLKQLVLYAFPERSVEFIQLSEAELFKAVAAIPSLEFTEDNLFVAWFYARWILHLDRISRFPTITVKPTVANPTVQVDQVLLTAEQHGLCIQTTRPLTPIAAKFLQQLESLPIDRIRIPTVECFLFKNYMKENLNVWEENIEPDFQQSDIFIPMEWIIYKTRFDLFHANYAAAQFRTSKMLLKLLLDTKPDFCSLSPELRDYVYFDYDKLEHFKTALGITTSEPVKLSESMVDVSSATTAETQAKAIVYGSMISREMIIDKKTKDQSIQALERQMEKSNLQDEKLRTETALFCIKEIDSPLIASVTENVPTPSEEYFNKFVVSGPILFAQYSTIKPDIFEQFYDLNKVKYPPKFPERYTYPEEVADFIYRVCPKDLHPLLFLLIGKAKQLQNVSLYKSWEKIIDYFLNIIAKSLPPNHPQLKEIQSVLILEALNVKLRPAYTTISFQDVSTVEQLTTKCDRLLQSPSNTKSMIKFFQYYLPALLNVKHYGSIQKSISLVKDDVCYKFFASFVSLLSLSNDNNYSMDVKKDFFEQYVSILRIFSDEVSSRKLLFTSKDFVDMIQNICEPNAIKQLLNYTLHIYNRWFFKSNNNTSHILINLPEMFKCFILPDSYILDPADTRFDNNWGTRKDIVHEILDVCLKVSNRICSNDAFVLRATGDYTFVINNYDASLQFYLNCILVLTNYLSHPFTYNNASLIDDLFWKKVVTCLIELKRPTEAVITCQLITNMFEILPHIHSLLFPAEPDCEDASSQYFQFIGDIAIFEAMSAAYVRQGLLKCQRRLIENVLSRTFHSNGSVTLHNHETLRRKSHWIQVLCSEVFDSFDYFEILCLRINLGKYLERKQESGDSKCDRYQKLIVKIKDQFKGVPANRIIIFLPQHAYYQIASNIVKRDIPILYRERHLFPVKYNNVHLKLPEREG